MEEVRKCAQVLRQISHDAGFAMVTVVPPDSVRFCVHQYNQIYARLSELCPEVEANFLPLSEAASPADLRMTARALAVYIQNLLAKKKPSGQQNHLHRAWFNEDLLIGWL